MSLLVFDNQQEVTQIAQNYASSVWRKMTVTR
jgi:hypothetical protein